MVQIIAEKIHIYSFTSQNFGISYNEKQYWKLEGRKKQERNREVSISPYQGPEQKHGDARDEDVSGCMNLLVSTGWS